MEIDSVSPSEDDRRAQKILEGFDDAGKPGPTFPEVCAILTTYNWQTTSVPEVPEGSVEPDKAESTIQGDQGA